MPGRNMGLDHVHGVSGQTKQSLPSYARCTGAVCEQKIKNQK